MKRINAIKMALFLIAVIANGASADTPTQTPTLRLDYTPANPLSLVVKDQHLVEDALGPDVTVEWIRSASAQASLLSLDARSLDIGSCSAATALAARVDGIRVRLIYVTGRPESTALVTRADSPISGVGDLKGKRVAATRGSDSRIFLLRALAANRLAPGDITIVPLRQEEGRVALDRGEVDAWAGLDPVLASAERESGDRPIYRNREFNSESILAAREAFLAEHDDWAAKVVASYEQARLWAQGHPSELSRLVAQAAAVSTAVADQDLARIDFSDPAVDDRLHQSVAAEGAALMAIGLVPADTDAEKLTGDLLLPRLSREPPTR
jgi:sulfonate transport system substrate-binding protein